MFLLEPVGLSQVENDVYVALVELRRADADAIADHVRMSGRAVRTALARLVTAGLAFCFGGTPPTYLVVPPEVGVSALVDRRRGELARLQVELEELAARQRPDRLGGDALVELVVGDDAVIATATKLQLEARTELLVIETPPYTGGTPASNDVQFERMAEGVTYRVIYSSAALSTPAKVQAMRQWVSAGEQARILPDIRTKLLVMDGRVAVLPVSYDPIDPSKRLVISSPALVQLVVGYFEALWERASPVEVDIAEEAEIAARDRELLALLTAGMKDATIARTMGIGERTVGRRVTELMRVLGAETRFQAGVLATRRGWL
ncbi:helix-turn-helix transcriptional regulator [Actinokineospora sp. HUAS TT18]|uniref:helix-turn-helix transcriptional regulator n=1 Tax=Actinokineospora sp. HUAS TT18 TaxID=3447451 RepID=UPI003F52347E